MNQQEKIFFEKIEEASKENPAVRIGAAGDYIKGLLKRAFTNSDGGTDASMWVYMIAALTGVSVAEAAKDIPDTFVAEIFKDTAYMPMTRLETKKGNFWIGDKLNIMLCGGSLSAWEVAVSSYKGNREDIQVPSAEEYVGRNAKMMGSDIKLWNGAHDPYEEIESAKNTYATIKNRLEPYKLEPAEYHIAFSIALGEVMAECEKYFPAGMNCFDMSMETMMFIAHME